MGDDIKTVVLTGGAAESMNPSSHEGGATRKKKALADKKIVTKVGAGMSPGTLDQLASTRAPGPLPPALEPRINIPVLGAAQPIRIGGSNPQKVILAKTSKLKKVFLAPSVKSTGQAVAQAPIKKKKTMKRIRISIGGKQITKAKTIRNKSSGKTLSEVKASLAKAGLINPDTKAPEEVLRGMHGDLMVLKKRAL
jgi:hypothetical protein